MSDWFGTTLGMYDATGLYGGYSAAQQQRATSEWKRSLSQAGGWHLPGQGSGGGDLAALEALCRENEARMRQQFLDALNSSERAAGTAPVFNGDTGKTVAASSTVPDDATPLRRLSAGVLTITNGETSEASPFGWSLTSRDPVATAAPDLDTFCDNLLTSVTRRERVRRTIRGAALFVATFLPAQAITAAQGDSWPVRVGTLSMQLLVFALGLYAEDVEPGRAMARAREAAGRWRDGWRERLR